MKIVNCTPHEIVLLTADGERKIPPSGTVARFAETTGEKLEIGAPCDTYAAPVRGPIEGLPEPEPDTILVVSGLLAAAARRPDVYSPGTGPRDNPRREAGQITGVRRLIRSC